MTDLAMREVGVTPTDPPMDRSRLPISLVSLAFLLLGLVGWIAQNNVARGTGFLLYVLVGFGSATLVILRRSTVNAVAFSAPISVSIAVLAGFIMVETHTWGAGHILFIILVVASACVHGLVLREARAGGARALGGRRSRPDVLDENEEADQSCEREGTATRIWSSETLVVALSLTGLIACLASAADLYNFNPTSTAALFGAISPAWYLGFVIIAAAVFLGFRQEGSGLAMPVISLCLAVTMTPSLAYAEPHLPWAAKHVGVTLYIMAHGSVNPHIDILQAWPGLFAAVAWLCQSIGIPDPMVIARWWQPAIDLVTLLVFQRLAWRALNDVRRSWIAAALLVVGNMIGQDYYSPQSTGFLLALAIFALLYRRRDEPIGIGRADFLLVIGMTAAVAVTHQLTPYIVFGVSVVLLVFGQIKTRIYPPIILLVAVGWAFVNRSIVSHFLSFNQLGSVATNILPKGLANTTIHKSTLIHVDSYAMALDLLIIGFIAMVVILRSRTLVHLTFALCALSGFGLFLGSSYGNEGAFRVALFALPWLAILCADWIPVFSGKRPWLPIVVLPILIACYLFASLGLEYIRAVRTGDLIAMRRFEQTAPSRSELFILGDGYAPIRSSARYTVFAYRNYPYVVTPGNVGNHYNPETSYTDFVASRLPRTNRGLRRANIYVLAAQEPAAAMVELNLATIAEYRQLTDVFAHSSSWQLVIHTQTASLFRLRSIILQTEPLTVIGMTQAGNIVTASDARWVSTSHFKLSYQWELCDGAGNHCSAIVGATHKSYVVPKTAVGDRLTVTVTATNAQKSTARASARASGLVTDSVGP